MNPWAQAFERQDRLSSPELVQTYRADYHQVSGSINEDSHGEAGLQGQRPICETLPAVGCDCGKPNHATL